MKKILLITLLCLTANFALSLPVCHFEHYSTDDGLPQFSITDIIQDRKGFMWFATWDGFSKFDGYTFRNFKVRRGDAYQMNSNRIQHIYEDRYGYIWLHSHNSEAHCFDPQTETFKEIKILHDPARKIPFKMSQIKICPSGKRWIISQNDGCICVYDSLLSTKLYNTESERIKSNKVHRIYEDKELNTWILTDNGLTLVRDGDNDAHSFFFENRVSESNQHFFSVAEFPEHIWFGCNKGRIWIYCKSTGKFDLLQTPSQSDLTSLTPLPPQKVIIATSGDGFFVYDTERKTFKPYNTKNRKAIKSDKIRALHIDRRQQFWFETDGLGIYKFNPEDETVKYYLVQVNDPSINTIPPASDIVEDTHGQLWIHPRGGGFSFYNPETDTLEPFYNKESSPDWRFSNILHSLYSDRQGNLWFCTRSHGLEKVTFSNNLFEAFPVSQNLKSPVANDVRAVFQDDARRLWVATKDQHLTVYDEHYKPIGYFSETGIIGAKPDFTGVVYCMLTDHEKNIWLGTRTNGVFKLQKTADPLRYSVKHFRKDPNDIYSLSEDAVYSIFEDSNRNVWIGTYGGGINLVQSDENGKTIFINHKNHLKNYPVKHGARIRHITETQSGNLCIGTTEGLIMSGINFTSPDDIQYKYYTRIAGDKASLSNNDIHGILCTSSNELFLVTFGGGINRVAEYDPQGFPLKFESYTMQEGLPSDVCLAILEDENRQLWVSMENNLIRFNPATQEFKTFADIKRLMSNNSFSEASACRLANGELVFGFSNGLLHFQPRNIRNSNIVPYIALSGFRLHNRVVPIGEQDSPIDKEIDSMDKLVLSHDQRSFGIEFSALDFTSPNISYAYKLEGFDNDWIYTHQKRIVNYTNIPQGDYLFRVRSTNGEGIWAENERSLPIKVLPAYWETPWAFAIYILLFIGFIYTTLHILFTFYRLKKDVEIEKELSDMKLRFFTNISHEIRTPLTMISAPVDFLLADEEIPDHAKTHLKSISKNANRMLRLVNQILDFRKIQQTKLKVQEIDLGEAVRNVCDGFNELANNRDIRFSYSHIEPGKKIWASADAIDIMLNNLLSNAFKYTPEGKTITVTVAETEKQFSIAVKDEGCGIPKEKQKKLFVRFNSFNEDPTQPSTGIGLSLIKDLADKHAAKIVLESEPGTGSTFTIIFLKGKEHFRGDVEFASSDQIQQIKEMSEPFEEEIHGSNTDKQHTILIVEDDSELRNFIRSVLQAEYHVLEAADGIEGLDIVEKEYPDLIVSDIMMPRMDGIELLQNLKGNINISHIPVILLTAKTTIENKLEGLNLGADDYITKPFSVQLFKSRIRNLLEQRMRLQEIYRTRLTSSPKADTPDGTIAIAPQIDVFIQRVIEITEAHLDEGEFTIDDLSAAFNMSRSVFSNKIKSLTGLPPFDLIREVRLKTAAQLLTTGEYMVKEVSSRIGIADTKYFGKIFKAKYGVSPQEYKKNATRQSDHSANADPDTDECKEV